MPVTITEPEIEEEINIEPVIEKHKSRISPTNTVNIPKNILLRCKFKKRYNTATFTPHVEKNKVRIYVDFHSATEKSTNRDLLTMLNPLNSTITHVERGRVVSIRTIIRYLLHTETGDKIEWKFNKLDGKPRMYIEKV